METVTRSKLGRIIGGNLETCLDLTIEEASDDCCRLSMPARNNALNAVERVHGGAISALIDTAATAAAWARDGLTRHSRGATVSMAVNFIAGSRGETLIADARVTRRGRSMVFLEIDVCDDLGTRVAQGLVSYKLDPNSE